MAASNLTRPSDQTGTLIKAQRKPRAPKAILAACEKRLAAQLEAACLWPDRQRDKTWHIGDFAYFVLNFSSAPKAEVYVQFHSEPDADGVVVQVSSVAKAARGKKAPEPDPQARKLLDQGFEAGGMPSSFFKIVPAHSAKELRALARAAVGILCSVLGYDGTTALNYRLHLGTRLQQRRVFDAICPSDLAKLMRRWGFIADVDHHDDNHNFITSSVDAQPFFVAFVGEHPEGSHEYGMIELRSFFRFDGGMPEGLPNAINQNFITAKAAVDEEGDLIVQTAILLHGGVTEPSMALSFGIWKETLAEIVKGLE